MPSSLSFRPRTNLTARDTAAGLRLFTWEGVASNAMFSVTTSGLLAAFALALGANNLQIGVLAALPFLTQPFQIPTILLVERVRLRKLIATVSYGLAQVTWVLLALIPFMVAGPGVAPVGLLLGIFSARSVLTAVCGCAWNSWVRDLVPREVLGNVFSRRLAYAGLGTVAFGVLGAVFVDWWRGHSASADPAVGYALVLLVGAVTIGLASPVLMAFTPEPRMATTTEPSPSLRKTLAAPFRDRNFAPLVRFLFLWGFASNLAVPFFAVYMLQRLHMSVTAVLALSVLAQVSNVTAMRLWGRIADKLGNKVVLAACASLYVVVIAGWVFTAMPERYALTVPLLVLLHLFLGIASAGVTLSVGIIGLKLAPNGQGTAYLAGASLATSLGAGLGPLVGGLFADYFAVRHLTLTVGWQSPESALSFPAIQLTGFGFLFVVASLLGLLTLRGLRSVREEGEVSRDVVLDELLAQTRQVWRPLSSAPGLRFLTAFPYTYLRRVPGINVAVGVTAYQVAVAAHGTAVTAARGGRTTREAVGAVIEGAGEIGRHAAGWVRLSTRGLIHSVGRRRRNHAAPANALRATAPPGAAAPGTALEGVQALGSNSAAMVDATPPPPAAAPARGEGGAGLRDG